MTTQSITSGQRKQLIRFGSDAIKAVMAEMGLGKDAAQRVIAQGGEFQRRIGEAVRQAFRDLGADQSAPAVSPIWKTVTLGLHKDEAALRAALASGGYRIGDYASQILAKTPLAATETTVDLVRLSVREMGFLNGATTAEIYARIRELGLMVCPAEVGPALRLADADQPIGEWIRVGMEPIAGSDGGSGVFGVGRDVCGRWLDTVWADPAGLWFPEDVWVFARSKQ